MCLGLLLAEYGYSNEKLSFSILGRNENINI